MNIVTVPPATRYVAENGRRVGSHREAFQNLNMRTMTQNCLMMDRLEEEVNMFNMSRKSWMVKVQPSYQKS